MNFLSVFVYIVVCAVVGIGLGFIIQKVFAKFKERKIQKNALKVINGEKDNIITLDNGQKQEVSKFVVYDNNDKPILINLKGEKIDGSPNN